MKRVTLSCQRMLFFILLAFCAGFGLTRIFLDKNDDATIKTSCVKKGRVESHETSTTTRKKQDHYEFTREMKELNEVKVEADNPQLVDLIRKYYITPPSTQPYDLESPDEDDNSMGQAAFVDSKLRYKECGFFIECGAFDGETLSNTLFFEQKRGWTGILIEPNPVQYKNMLTKHRKAFTIKACLSTEDYPSEKLFSLDHLWSRIHGESNQSNVVRARKTLQPVQCFPLYSILLAMNQTNVDYLSLDVEGAEQKVLDTIPWQKVNIQMMTIEYNKWDGGTKSLCEYMERRGYECLLTISGKYVEDVILRKRPEH